MDEQTSRLSSSRKGQVGKNFTTIVVRAAR